MKPKIRLTIRAPRGPKGSFQLLKDVLYPNGDREQESLKDPTLIVINQKFKDKQIDINTAKTLIEDLKSKILTKCNHEEGIKTSKFILDDNLKIFNQYWSKNYEERDIEELSIQTAKSQFNSILEILGKLSLRTAKLSQIKSVLEASKYSKETLRHMNHKVNALLAEAGNSIKLKKQPKIHKDISHITLKELDNLVKHVSDDTLKSIIRICFYTGVRTGELFALSEDSINFKKGIITINKQLSRANVIKNPKQNKNRVIFLPDTIVKDIKYWCSLDSEIKNKYRYSASKELLRISKIVFPKNKLKHISLHDLRRSFVIYNLQEIGMTLSEVAFLIGDTLAVLQANYSGYSYQEDGLDNLRRKYSLS